MKSQRPRAKGISSQAVEVESGDKEVAQVTNEGRRNTTVLESFEDPIINAPKDGDVYT